MDTPQPAEELSFAASDAEAKSRAEAWHSADPLSDISPSLLSAADVARYVAKTGMIYPFDKKRLKTASYEVRPGGEFIYWDKSGKKAERQQIAITDKTSSIVLPANSISYLQSEVFFRLPLYMAVRFNLRIKHVHRGLLLGTGPIVDPGFCGRLLIPLHNLTSTEYMLDLKEADGDDGLIWLEFTKTTFKKIEGEKYDFDPDKSDKSPDYYLRAANGSNPILSSIYDGIQQSRLDAERAAKSSAWMRNFGFVALLGVLIGGSTLVINVLNVAQGSVSLSTTVRNNIETLTLNLKKAESDIRELREKLNEEAERTKKLTATSEESKLRHAPKQGAVTQTP